MPCEVDRFGFCTKCAKCVQPCDHLERNLCRRSPHLNTCFQWISQIRNCEYDSNVKMFSMCTYNVGFNVKITKLVKFLQKEPADIICIHEIAYWQVNQLINCLKKSKWSYCGRSPECRSIVLSIFPLEEVCRGYLGGSTHVTRNQFVTVRVQGFYLTSLHLAAKNEATRLRQLRNVRVKLSEKGVWNQGRMHIFAGDFNSLTKEDKSQEAWDKVAADRELSNQNNFAKLEEPKFDVTAFMAQENFTDCWAKVGRRDEMTTCQYDTRVDYIFCGQEVKNYWKATEAWHCPKTISDHNAAYVVFERGIYFQHLNLYAALNINSQDEDGRKGYDKPIHSL